MSLENPTITDASQTIIQPGRYAFIFIDNKSDTDVHICVGGGDLVALDGIRIPAGEQRHFVNGDGPLKAIGQFGMKIKHKATGENKEIVLNYEKLP